MEGLTPYLVLGLLGAFVSWVGLAALTIVGRLAHERRRRETRYPATIPPGRRGRRLVAHASRHRFEAGKWRRIAALRTLMAAGHPRARGLVRRALADPDRDVVGAVVRGLGELDVPWAADALVEVLRRDGYARSRVASQLERMSLGVAPLLEPLLVDPQPAVRFWAATLLGRCPGTEPERLVPLTRDDDANVRAAAVEALAELGHPAALRWVRDRLRDEKWFVRVHACRAVGRLGSADDAAAIAGSLGDPWWWVRSAAKDALRGFGIRVAGVLVALLDDDDAFVRNGAAEVLQDIGFLDALARSGREGELVERIFAAGGPAMRQAAYARWRSQSEERPAAGVGA